MQAGNTALIRAVLNGHVEVVVLLLSRGVNKDHHNKVKSVQCCGNVYVVALISAVFGNRLGIRKFVPFDLEVVFMYFFFNQMNV